MRWLWVAAMVLTLGCSDGDDGSGGAAGSGASSGSTGSGGSGAVGATGGVGGGSSGSSAGGASGSAGASAGGSSGSSGELAGYWVWEQTVEDGAVTLTITDDDMVSKVGPSGWDGCPEGILCTKYGIRKLAFGPKGEFWRMNNVKTGSDTNLIGSYAVDGATVSVQQEHRYSCAHPDQNEPLDAIGYFNWKIENGRLWVSQPMSDAPPVDPNDWLVLKPVSEADFYGKYMVRICQDYGKEPECHPGCFSNDYGK